MGNAKYTVSTLDGKLAVFNYNLSNLKLDVVDLCKPTADGGHVVCATFNFIGRDIMVATIPTEMKGRFEFKLFLLFLLDVGLIKDSYRVQMESDFGRIVKVSNLVATQTQNPDKESTSTNNVVELSAYRVAR